MPVPPPSTIPPTPPTPAAPIGRPPGRGGGVNLEHGLKAVKDRLRDGKPEVFLEFSTLESRLLANIHDERVYGSSEMNRSERARIIHELNRLAIENLGVSFNELCQIQKLDTLPAPQLSTSKAIRELLIAAFSDEELTTMCYDRFHPIYETFASGMGKAQKVQRLVEYCERQGQIDVLLDLVRDLNPAQYARFEERLG